MIKAQRFFPAIRHRRTGSIAAIGTACLLISVLVPPSASAVSVSLVSVDWSPRVIDIATTPSATATFVFAGDPTTVTLSDRNGTNPVTIAADGQMYVVTLDAPRLLDGYQRGLAHNFVGFLDAYVGTTLVLRTNVFINVRDATMPHVPLVTLSSDAQAAPHVVNIRNDGPFFSSSLSAGLRRLYELFPDRYDFVAIVQAVDTPENRHYLGVKNDVTGLGLSVFDHTATYGSAGALQGIAVYPISGFFDLANHGSVHELGHRWINFLSQAALAVGSPHWPISDVASGVMGFGIPPSGEGGDFPFVPVPLGNGDYRLDPAPDFGRFNDLELYLMGLLPQGSVGSHFVFDDQDQLDQVHEGGILHGPVTPVSIGDVVASDGPRVPAFPDTQRSFRVGTVVLSAGRLLSPSEMAFMDCMASRGEARTRVTTSEGFDVGTSMPFFVATSGRGSLSTAVGPPGPAPKPAHLTRIVYAPDPPSLVRETVRIRNGGCVPLNLKGWTLRDEDGNVFRFGRFVLGGGRVVTIHTGNGTDGPRDLYWGRTHPVWDDDRDTAVLRDRSGRRIDTCSYSGGGTRIDC